MAVAVKATLALTYTRKPLRHSVDVLAKVIVLIALCIGRSLCPLFDVPHRPHTAAKRSLVIYNREPACGRPLTAIPRRFIAACMSLRSRIHRTTHRGRNGSMSVMPKYKEIITAALVLEKLDNFPLFAPITKLNSSVDDDGREILDQCSGANLPFPVKILLKNTSMDDIQLLVWSTRVDNGKQPDTIRCLEDTDMHQGPRPRPLHHLDVERSELVYEDADPVDLCSIHALPCCLICDDGKPVKFPF